MNFDIELLHTVGKFTVSIILLLAFFLFTVKSHIRVANRIFAVFLLLIAFDLLGLFMYEWLNAHPYLDLLRRTSSLLQMPFFYFYVLAICYKDFKFNKNLIKHAIVFLLVWLLFIPRFALLDTHSQSLVLQNFESIEFILQKLIGEIQYFFYIFMIFKILIHYKKLYEENYSTYEHTAHRWLFQITIISLIAHIFSFTKEAMVVFGDPNSLLFVYLIISIIVLLIICWFVLKALYYPSLTRGVKSKDLVIAKNSSVEPSKKEQSKINKIYEYMELKEPYLESELTIEDLAELLDMSANELSTLINFHIGKNFFSFVNSYRIKKAQLMLKDPKFEKVSILQILYEIGFNSKSSFNTAFKKHTGVTPTAYRKNNLKK